MWGKNWNAISSSQFLILFTLGASKPMTITDSIVTISVASVVAFS